MTNDQMDIIAEELGSVHSILSTILLANDNVVTHSEDEIVVLSEYASASIEKVFGILGQCRCKNS